MKIRSITYFTNTGWPIQAEALALAEQCINAARAAFEQAGFNVQTTRLATPPFPLLIRPLDTNAVVDFSQALEEAGQSAGYDYVAIGPALPAMPESYTAITPVLAATRNLFVSGLMTTPDHNVSLAAVRACAQAIQANAPLEKNGFANLRFGALANLPPGGPFLPGAYHAGERPAFALAMEAADLAVEAVSEAPDLESARRRLARRIEEQAAALESIADSLAQRLEVSFGGIDFTLAPFPEPRLSFGTAMERLGIPAVGLHGSLAAAALLTDTLDRAEYPRAGFNGLMLPVLEDATLAQRAAEGILTVKDLLLYAAVCGAGLDTIPLPGDASEEQLYAVLLDVAALALRLDKPLIARLMPIPDKKAGDLTTFDFAYFANSRVLALEAQPLSGLLASEGAFSLRSRKS